MSEVTLIDGRTFPADSVLVRHERDVMADEPDSGPDTEGMGI